MSRDDRALAQSGLHRSAPRRRATLRRRLGLALIAGGLALAVVAGAAGVALWQMLDRQTLVADRYFDVITAAESAYTGLVDAETAVRGYALTGSQVTLEPFMHASDAVETFAAVADSPDGVPMSVRNAAGAAVVAAESWLDDFAKPTIAAVRSGGTSAVSAEDISAGQSLFGEARSAVESYLAELRDRRGQAVDQLDRWTRLVILAMVVLLVAAPVVGFLLWRYLRRWIAEPLHALSVDSRAVASGDLHHRVSTTGPGEIADLAEDVERMRLTLVGQVQALDNSRAEVESAHRQVLAQAEELRRSNRDLEQFAYVASHDLQEPLRKVAGFTQLLQKRYGGRLDDRADQYIGFAVDGAKRMQLLIQDLLGFSRVGWVHGEPAEVALDSALADAVGNLERLIQEAGAEVTHDELPVVLGERGLLVQLLQNLIGNAVKFRAPDRPSRVHLSARRVGEDGEDWELTCRDNGIGIDVQYADRVFVIFQRLHPKEVYEGTGIGLALCKKIVEYHGGRIWLGETGGPGASICWTLPAGPTTSTEERE